MFVERNDETVLEALVCLC